MKLDYIKMKNYMIYRDFNKKFKDKDVIGVICEWKSNPKKSNRGGKSVILEAAKYCLFGLSRAPREVSLIHHGQDDMFVEVGLVDEDGNKYKIKRSRDKNNKGLLECDWIDKKKEAQQAINEIIGCDGKEFELTNFFKQSDINQFMEMGSTKQKSYLMKWFKQLHWPKLEAEVGEDLKELKSKLSELKTKKETLIEDLMEPDEAKKRIKKIEESIEKKRIKHSKIVKKQKKLEAKLKQENDVEETETRIEEIEEEIIDIEQQIEDAIEAKKSYKKTKESLAAWKEDLKNSSKFSKKKYNQAVSDEREAVLEKKKISKTIEQVEESFCGVCPILNEGCDRVKLDPKQIKKMKKRVKELNAFSQELNGLMEEMTHRQEAEHAVNKLQNSLELKRERLSSTKALKNRVKTLEAENKRLKRATSSVDNSTLEGEIESFSSKAKEIQFGLDNLNQKLGKYKSNIVRYEKAKKKASKLEEKIKALESKVEDLKYLAFMFGKNGIPSQEIENAFQEIEDEVNYILERMGTTLSVSFKADRELGQWEPECVGCGWRFPKGYKKKECSKCGQERKKRRKDELHFTVEDNGNESVFEMESGGGKTFVSLAIRIALTRLKQRQTGSNFNVLFLDEIDSALDEDAKRNIMNLVTKVLLKDFNFSQIFWVSHDAKIKNSVTHLLKVIRYRGYAKAKWW